MEQVKSNPLSGSTNTGITMGDSRWPSSEGWQKRQQVVTYTDGTKVTIHFNYTPLNGGLFDDFKFVFPK